jgi:hypothetical protein
VPQDKVSLFKSPDILKRFFAVSYPVETYLEVYENVTYPVETYLEAYENVTLPEERDKSKGRVSSVAQKGKLWET